MEGLVTYRYRYSFANVCFCDRLVSKCVSFSRPEYRVVFAFALLTVIVSAAATVDATVAIAVDVHTIPLRNRTSVVFCSAMLGVQMHGDCHGVQWMLMIAVLAATRLVRDVLSGANCILQPFRLSFDTR